MASDPRAELLRRRLAAQRAAESAAGRIPRRAADSAPVLSFAQERFWFLQTLEPSSTEYVIAAAVRLRGALDVRALEEALERLVARHPALRTTFPTVDGAPAVCVALPGPRPLERIELSSLPAPERESALLSALRRLAETPLDLARGPLWRPLLFRLAVDDHALAIVQHHIVTDAWSVRVAMGELATLYAARRRGEETRLEPLELDPLDHAAWQRATLRGERLEALLAPWRARLADAPPPLELGADRPRPPLLTHRGLTHREEVPAAVMRGVEQAGRAAGATAFATLLAAFQAFLARVAGARDLVVGTSHANRDRRELRQLVGAFVNTLALRARIDPSLSFPEHVARTAAVLREAQAHADLPFELLVAELAPARDPSRSPLFDVFFDLGPQVPPPSFDGLAVEPVELDAVASSFDLAVAVEDRGDAGASLRFEANADLFDRATVAALAHAFAAALAALAADPARPVGALPLVTPRERQALLARGPSRAPVAPETVDVLFARAASEHGARIAIRDGDRATTYEALGRRSDALAAALGSLERGAPVAVLLPRSVDAVAAMLAAWKAGGAYLPLDPEHPPERLRAALDDAGAAAVIAAATLRERLGGNAARWVDPERVLASSRYTARPIASDQLAYVVFTSGSTGRPKGVGVPHGSLANLIASGRTTHRFAPGARFLARTPATFDASLWELVHPLCSGGELVIAPTAVQADTDALLALVARERVAVLQVVPSVLRLWLESPRLAECRDLRLVICAGEPLTEELAARWFAAMDAHGLEAELWNNYGPSEACVDATSARVERGHAARGRLTVPIGRPLHGVHALVVDALGEPLPPGLVGELWIGGAGLAQGYMGDPERTGQRFVEAFGLGRFYRSGDRVRELPDGALEHLGRLDDQVKLAGQRIEPGEIEAHLRDGPDVADAAVVVREEGEGGARLVAYVVPRAGAAAPRPARLAEHLAARLPRAWLPSAYVMLAALPLTASEKLDRRALPAPPRAIARATDPPRDPLEAELAARFEALLGVDGVGRDDDFFALGGHSLLAARLVLGVREHHRVEVPLVAFFERPSVAALAELVRVAARVAPAAVADGDNTVVSFAEERLWILDRLEGGSATYHVTGGLRLAGELDAAALERALDAIAARHETWRSAYVERAGRPVRVLAKRVELDVGQVDLSGLPADERERALLERLRELGEPPFDLARAPLVRLELVRLGTRDHALLVAQHHIVTDGTSLALLVHELGQAYREARTGRAPATAAHVPGYAAFAAWQRARLTGDRDAACVAFWRASLDGAPLEHAWRPDRAPSAPPAHAGRVFEMPLGAGTAAAVSSMARNLGVTPFACLLGAFAVTFARWTGETDLVLGTAIGGRDWPGSERLLGLFVNAVPLRLRLADAADGAAAVRHASTVLRAALAHADLPFERIVEAIAPPRGPGRPPLFQVSFDALGAREDTAAFEGLDVRTIEVDPGLAKLDCSIAVDERGGEIVLRVEHSTERYERATVEGLIAAYRALLGALVAEPARPLAELPLVAARDEAHARHRSSAAVVDAPLVPTWLARMRAQHGARTAVRSGQRATSYAELDARVGRVARALVARGAAPGRVVALELCRGADLVLAQLAVWHAGAAWCVLDAADPPERRTRALQRLAPVATVDAAWVKGAAEALDGSAELVPVTPGDPAYVIATSGTSGEPKLVVVPHRALAHHTARLAALFEVEPSDVFFARIAPTFDAALIEWLTPLAAGALLALPCDGAFDDPAAFLDEARRLGATVLGGVPAWLRALVADGERWRALDRLRLVFAGGESLPADVARRVHLRARAMRRDVALWHLYGPAEACIDSAAHRVGPAERDPVPIGAAFPGVDLHLLEPGQTAGRARPAGDGQVGELWIGGPGLALGYAGDERATRERFVELELERGRYARLYRTGDLARRRADGALVFAGRADREAKLGGRRVDVDELEALVRAVDGVRDAAVVVERGASAPRLVVHFEGEVDAALVRASFSARAPHVARPAAWIAWESLPRSASGKLDLRRIAATAEPLAVEAVRASSARELEDTSMGPASEASRASSDSAVSSADGTAPDAALERARALVGAVIGIAAVPPDADFFALGGTSLAAIELAVRLRDEAGDELDLPAFLRAPTARSLARRLAGGWSGSLAMDAAAGAAPHRARLERDARLAVARRAAPARAGAPPRHVLLTGATGFLGAFLLEALLARGVERVTCLARARDDAHARARILANLARLGLDLGERARRIDALASDLERAGVAGALASDLERRDIDAALLGDADVIVHAAARVDFLRGYDALAAANVEGTRALLHAALERGVPFHFVSTIGVLAAHGALARARLDEEDAFDDPTELEGGYEQTKWVAERLVAEAGRRGLPVACWRPGRVAGATTGAWNADDFACRTLRGCLALGIAPDLDVPVDVTPVDFAAAAIAHGVTRGAIGGFHVVHERPTPFGALFARARARGGPLELVSPEAWRRRVAEARLGPEHPLFPLLPALLSRGADETAFAPDLLLPELGRARFAELLARGGPACPPIDDAQLDRWLDWLGSPRAGAT